MADVVDDQPAPESAPPASTVFGYTSDGRPKKDGRGRPKRKDAKPAHQNAKGRAAAKKAAKTRAANKVKPPARQIQPPAPPSHATSPFGSEALPPPSARAGTRIADEAGFEPPKPPPAAPPATPASSSSTPEPEDGKAELGEALAEEYVGALFIALDLIGGLAVRLLFKKKNLPPFIIDDMCELQRLTPSDRESLRPMLVKRLAKVRMSEEDIFYGTLVMFEFQRFQAVQSYANAWVIYGAAKDRGETPPQPERTRTADHPPASMGKPPASAAESAAMRDDIASRSVERQTSTGSWVVALK